LRDIGYAEVGAADERNAVRVNGNPSVGLGIVKQSTANTLSVAQAVRALLPGHYRQSAGRDEDHRGLRRFDLHRTLHRGGLHHHAGSAGLVAVVIFLFLRNGRATLIPLVTIPVSLIGAFIFLYALGFTINTLTLLGLVLAIGMVVDDAIVVMENIHRHIEDGMTPFKAALHGSQGNCLRGAGDDHYPGGGVHPAGVHDRQHRAAVHRVCLHRGGGGAGVRLRGADPDPDDVFQAAAPRAAAQLAVQYQRALFSWA
jgi:hypothetical protein